MYMSLKSKRGGGGSGKDSFHLATALIKMLHKLDHKTPERKEKKRKN
jgi:hypothetical protein